MAVTVFANPVASAMTAIRGMLLEEIIREPPIAMLFHSSCLDLPRFGGHD